MNSRTFGISFASAFTGMKEKSDKIKLAICDSHVRENAAIQKRLRAEKNLGRAITKQNRLWQKISSVDLRNERVQRNLQQRKEKLDQVEKIVQEKKGYVERLKTQERVIHELDDEIQTLRQQTKQIQQKTKKALELIEKKSSKLEEAYSRAEIAEEKYKTLKVQRDKANKDVKILKRRSGECTSPSGIENRLKGKINFATQRAATLEDKESALEEEIILKEDETEDFKTRRKRIEAKIRELTSGE